MFTNYQRVCQPDLILVQFIADVKRRFGSLRILTHWGRVTHICVSKLTIIDSVNGLSPDRRQAIIWTDSEMLLIGPLGTNFNEILSKIPAFSFKKMHLKMSPAKWRTFWPRGDELNALILEVELQDRPKHVTHHYVREALHLYAFFVCKLDRISCDIDAYLPHEL